MEGCPSRAYPGLYNEDTVSKQVFNSILGSYYTSKHKWIHNETWDQWCERWVTLLNIGLEDGISFKGKLRSK